LETESVVSLHSSDPEPLMSALGQKQTLKRPHSMSALPPKADIAETDYQNWTALHTTQALAAFTTLRKESSSSTTNAA
jgi:hypothetical protein